MWQAMIVSSKPYRAVLCKWTQLDVFVAIDEEILKLQRPRGQSFGPESRDMFEARKAALKHTHTHTHAPLAQTHGPPQVALSLEGSASHTPHTSVVADPLGVPEL
jgi:hypothetical protein